MKESKRIYNMKQANEYVRMGAFVCWIGFEHREGIEKPFTYVKFQIDNNYLDAKKSWMSKSKDR